MAALSRWDQVPCGEPEAQLAEAAETGRQALVLWHLGEDRVRRSARESITARTVTVSFDGPSTTRVLSLRTEAEQAEADDDIDAYLADAEIPPRPRGCRWFYRTPAGLPTASTFWSALNSGLEDAVPRSPRPSDYAAVLPSVIARLYRGSGAN